MRRVSILVLVLNVSIFSFARISGTSVAAPVKAIAAASPWWSPLLSLASALLSALNGGNSAKKTVQQTLPSTAKQMDDGLTLLQAWPSLLRDSERLRQDAIQLGQQADLLGTYPDSITDDQWSDFTTQVKLVQQEYDGIYSNQTNKTILVTYGAYNPTVQSSGDAWNTITKVMGHQNKTAAQRLDTIQQVHGVSSAVTAAAMLPEWWAIDEATTLAGQYKAVTTQAKSVTQGKGGATATGTNGSNTTSYSRRPSNADFRLAYVAFDIDHRRPVRGTPARQPSSEAGESPVSTRVNPESAATDSDLGEAARLYNRAPPWVTTTLYQTRNRYRVDWKQSLIAGLAGAAVGFMVMLLLTAAARHYLAPGESPQLDALSRSLSFRGDGEDDLDRELGALHLDVLRYVFQGPAAEPKLAFNLSEGSGAQARSGRLLTRIEDLRKKLKEDAQTN
jgi:hypothetical protein